MGRKKSVSVNTRQANRKYWIWLPARSCSSVGVRKAPTGGTSESPSQSLELNVIEETIRARRSTTNAPLPGGARVRWAICADVVAETLEL